MIMQQTCGRCRGNGKSFAMLAESETVEVHIPPGCQDGHQIRCNEKGDQPRPDVIPADLVYHVSVEEHPDFERQGDDLIIHREISLLEVRKTHFPGCTSDDPPPHSHFHTPNQIS